MVVPSMGDWWHQVEVFRRHSAVFKPRIILTITNILNEERLQKTAENLIHNMQKASRMKRELAKLAENPPEGICCYPKDDRNDILSANILGPVGSPYEGGLFQLEVEIPETYPFEPPRLRFLTPVYHPNIDDMGRICMDLLKMPPKGGWKPSINIENLLTAVQLLLAYPNPDDPLMADIAEEYRLNQSEFLKKAKKSTAENAMKKRKNEFSEK